MRKILIYISGARRYMIVTILLNLAFAGMNIWYTDVFRRYFNCVQEGEVNALGLFVVLLISLELLMTVSHYISSLLSEISRRRVMRRVQESLFDHFLFAMSRETDKQTVGGMTALISNDARIAALGISSGAVRFVHLITRFTIYTAYLFWLNWQMALITITIGPLMLWFGRIFSKKIERYTKELRETEAECEETILAGVNALTFVKMNQLSGFMKRRYSEVWDKREKSSLKNDRISILYDEITSFLGVVGSVLILGVAAVLLAKGYLMVGTVVAYLQLHNEIVWPFIEISSLWRQLIGSKVSIARIEDALQIPAEKKTAYKEPENVLSIRANNVSFGYDTENVLLKNTNFSAHKGEVVCIVGENGAGKSTLLKLLSGLYLPDCGDIYLDNIHLTAENMRQVRSAYSFVMQHEHVFDGTIRDNLTYGKAYSQELIDTCAEQTGLMEYINGLENRYETRLTNGGISGGELKKLSLTRMLLADKPIIVLDEPFAHLDEEGCNLLLGLLQKLKKDKIIIFVTHNAELVQYADRVVKVENGKVM